MAGQIGFDEMVGNNLRFLFITTEGFQGAVCELHQGVCGVVHEVVLAESVQRYSRFNSRGVRYIGI